MSKTGIICLTIALVLIVPYIIWAIVAATVIKKTDLGDNTMRSQVGPGGLGPQKPV